MTGPKPPSQDLVPESARRHPFRPVFYLLRPMGRWVVRRRLVIRVHNSDLIPDHGPVIFASNHVGVADGPLLAIFAKRPVHALTKLEMFSGFMGRFLRVSGQIPVDRFQVDPAAVKSCLRVLRDGGAIGIFPEGARGAGDFTRFHRGAAYLALVTGAPIVPVVQLGTRNPGGTLSSIPPRGSVVDMVFGAPYQISATPWPRTREQVATESLLLRDHLINHLAQARALTGQDLPGPVPGDHEPDSSSITEEAS